MPFTIFENYSAGVKTNRDAWAYNSSVSRLAANMDNMISFYHACLETSSRRDINDPHKISWSWVLRERFKKNKSADFRAEAITKSLYRPYTRQVLYYDGFFNENRYLMPKIFPTGRESNRAIYITGPSAPAFSAIMVDTVPCLDVMSKGQCFPMYLYGEADTESDDAQGELLTSITSDKASNTTTRREAITDTGLAYFRTAFPLEDICKEDVFYYVYGLLHAPDYRDRYADNLAKELPRIPCVKAAEDFWAFSKAGRALADLHLNYETAPLYPLKIDTGNRKLTDDDYRVEKMKYAKKGKDKDLTTLIYNDAITLRGIPLEAYGYVVNGKPALDWVVERQCVTTDPASGIVNDANAWAIETMHNPRYPLELVQRVITVSLETLKIVNSLPPMVID